MTLGRDAYHGPAGDVALDYAPHTEADPAGILVMLLTLAGNVVGQKPQVHIVAGMSHKLTHQTVLVGDTAKARKSVGMGVALSLMRRAADAPWQDRVLSTFTSAEAIVAEVADPTTDAETKGTVGSTDKRLVISVSEMATQLDAAMRPGSSIFQVLRLAWDGAPLSAMSRRSKLRATSHHISLVGACTRSELRGKLSAAEAAAGTVNRMTFCQVTRTQELPFGGTMDPDEERGLVSHLRKAIDKARPLGIIGYDDEVRQWWGDPKEGKYHRIMASNGHDPLAAHFAREDVQIVRWAATYAALDGTTRITMAHMRAAQAVWDHSVETVRWIWGDPTQDRPVRKLLELVQGTLPPGLKRGDAMRAIGTHAADFDSRLDRLIDAGLVCAHHVRTATRGAPAQVIYPYMQCPFPTEHPMVPGDLSALAERARQT